MRASAAPIPVLERVPFEQDAIEDFDLIELVTFGLEKLPARD
ncbi:MAG TPA: hypothetical protein VJP02_11255 [Candidatus Sulfotelmatobacter sp.]|nr:hypothetical protein [Candidatus Sulfotelmatobacter sp.]